MSDGRHSETAWIAGIDISNASDTEQIMEAEVTFTEAKGGAVVDVPKGQQDRAFRAFREGEMVTVEFACTEFQVTRQGPHSSGPKRVEYGRKEDIHMKFGPEDPRD